MPSIYIVNPASTAPSYYSAEAYADEQGGWTPVAELAVVTVAALVPDGWDIRITDEAVSPVDLDAKADFVAITGKVSQQKRMFELAAEFRQRGSTVLIGGSFASLSPDDVRPHADILVTGELEETAARLFADLASGRWADRYDCGQSDMRFTPIPRWDLYPTHRAIAGALQTTRGCPFNCEFCDVIQYQGRKQRHKPLDQVIAELDALHAYGFRQVFLVDDNFTVHRRWAREVLDALTDWNAAHADDPVEFLTQASLDIARDPDLLNHCHAAGIRTLFVGVETTNEDSLRETGKRQNLLLPIAESISRIVSRGVAVRAGVIVGFDHDGPGIFDELLEFFQASPIPDLNLGVLTAPASTDLYRRLAREGRLDGDVWETTAGSPFETNIKPALMSREALLAGARRLGEELFRPERFERRMMNLIDSYGLKNEGPAPVIKRGRSSGKGQTMAILRRIASWGPSESKMIVNLLRYAGRRPQMLPMVMDALVPYEQARRVLDYAAMVAGQTAASVDVVT